MLSKAPNRATLNYLKRLLEEISIFETLLTNDLNREKVRSAFHHLILLTLGSSSSWERLYKVSGEIAVSPSTLHRYLTKVSAPSFALYPAIAKSIANVIKEEYAELEILVVQNEITEKKARDAANKKYTELVNRVSNIHPNTWYNCIAVCETKIGEEVPLQFGISFTCRGIYDFNDHFPYLCTQSSEENRHHGHLIISGPDGSALLPHIIQTRADILQAINDLEHSKCCKCYFASDVALKEWYRTCRNLVSKTEMKILPVDDSNKTKSISLEKLMWVF